MNQFAIILVAATIGTAAHADIAVSFVESAPKDRFEITNISTCPTGPMDVTIDLSGSSAGLIFDTTAQGQGVEVFQPFELVAGADYISGLPQVKDGDQQLTLTLADLPGQATVAFTIDVDDTLERSSNGQIMINGSEISGARVEISGAGLTTDASFDQTARADISANTCLT